MRCSSWSTPVCSTSTAHSHDYLASAEADTPRMRRVTARHVLTHTSGLPNWRHEPGPLAPETEPGETYAYSGEGFFYLQRVVERVTGRPIARLHARGGACSRWA